MHIHNCVGGWERSSQQQACIQRKYIVDFKLTLAQLLPTTTTTTPNHPTTTTTAPFIVHHGKSCSVGSFHNFASSDTTNWSDCKQYCRSSGSCGGFIAWGNNCYFKYSGCASNIVTVSSANLYIKPWIGNFKHLTKTFCLMILDWQLVSCQNSFNSCCRSSSVVTQVLTILEAK